MKTLAEGRSRANLTVSKINQLIIREELFPEDLSGFTEAQRNKIKEALYKRLETCQPNEKRSILNKMAALSGDPEIRKEVWELNHRSILSAISIHLASFGCMPIQATIAEKTELSRKCVSRHLDEYRNSDLYAEQMKKLKMMNMTVIEFILSRAVNGDLKAAKMYIDTLSKMEDKEEARITLKQQNNYIQLNGILISEEKLVQLAPEKIRLLESIFSDKANIVKQEQKEKDWKKRPASINVGNAPLRLQMPKKAGRPSAVMHKNYANN